MVGLGREQTPPNAARRACLVAGSSERVYRFAASLRTVFFHFSWFAWVICVGIVATVATPLTKSLSHLPLARNQSPAIPVIRRTVLVQVMMLASTMAMSTMMVVVVAASMKTPVGQGKYDHNLHDLSWCAHWGIIVVRFTRRTATVPGVAEFVMACALLLCYRF